MAYSKIESVEELKSLCTDEPLDCFVALNGGCRSSKVITYNELSDEFYIINEIDGTSEEIQADKFNKEFIGKALEKGALYHENKYRILSPDGFDINHDPIWYENKSAALLAFAYWKARYEKQGYYSSNKGRIKLDELIDNCEFILNK